MVRASTPTRPRPSPPKPGIWRSPAASIPSDGREPAARSATGFNSRADRPMNVSSARRRAAPDPVRKLSDSWRIGEEGLAQPTPTRRTSAEGNPQTWPRVNLATARPARPLRQVRAPSDASRPQRRPPRRTMPSGASSVLARLRSRSGAPSFRVHRRFGGWLNGLARWARRLPKAFTDAGSEAATADAAQSPLMISARFFSYSDFVMRPLS